VQISVSVLSTAGFGPPLARDERDLQLPSRSKERSWPHTHRQHGECGLEPVAPELAALSEIGDGAVDRVIAQLQRQHFDPPQFAHAGVSKYR